MPRHSKSRKQPMPASDSPLDVAVKTRDADVLANVERALAADEVLMAFQPIMQARAPRQVAFYEGLVRVLDATGRVIPAAQFIADAEQTQLGRKLDCKALRHGLRALKKYPDLRLSLNMSARSIGYKPWRQILNRFLKDDATLGERLILEISETSAMALPEIVAGFMAELQTHGVCFALDEFGSGQISVKALKSFYFDAVKLDGQFAKGIPSNADNQVAAAALMSVARHFDMFTVATRIEDPAEAQFLSAMGADCLQGYLFGAPSVRPPWLPQTESKLFA